MSKGVHHENKNQKRSSRGGSFRDDAHEITRLLGLIRPGRGLTIPEGRRLEALEKSEAIRRAEMRSYVRSLEIG